MRIITNQIQVKGTVKFMGMDIPKVYGGFGENNPVLLAKTISEIHERKLMHINELIKDHIKQFNIDGLTDLLDLKRIAQTDMFLELGFTKAQWGNANHVYLLSQRGYTILIKIMEDDKSWEVYHKLIKEYFDMKEEKDNNQQILLAIKQVDIQYKKMKLDAIQNVPEYLLGDIDKRFMARVYETIISGDSGVERENPVFEITTFLQDKGHSQNEAAKMKLTFGSLLSDRYEEINGVRPKKIKKDVNGNIRNVNYYELKDVPFIEDLYKEFMRTWS